MVFCKDGSVNVFLNLALTLAVERRICVPPPDPERKFRVAAVAPRAWWKSYSVTFKVELPSAMWIL